MQRGSQPFCSAETSSPLLCRLKRHTIFRKDLSIPGTRTPRSQLGWIVTNGRPWSRWLQLGSRLLAKPSTNTVTVRKKTSTADGRGQLGICSDGTCGSSSSKSSRKGKTPTMSAETLLHRQWRRWQSSKQDINPSRHPRRPGGLRMPWSMSWGPPIFLLNEKNLWRAARRSRGSQDLAYLGFVSKCFLCLFAVLCKLYWKSAKAAIPPNSSPLTRAFLNPVEVDPTIGHKQIIRSVISQDASYMAFRASTVNVQGR